MTRLFGQKKSSIHVNWKIHFVLFRLRNCRTKKGFCVSDRRPDRNPNFSQTQRYQRFMYFLITSQEGFEPPTDGLAYHSYRYSTLSVKSSHINNSSLLIKVRKINYRLEQNANLVLIILYYIFLNIFI